MPEVLETASSMLARVPGTIGAWIFQRDADGTLVLVRSWQATSSAAKPPSSAALGKLIHQRWIAAHRLGQSSAEFAKPFAPSNARDTLVVPMLIGEELVGAFAVQRRDGETFPYMPEDIVTLATIAGLTAQQMQLSVLRERTAGMSNTAALKQEIMDEAYRAIAHELHDGIVQDLAYMRLRLEMLKRSVDDDKERALREADEIREQFNEAIDNLRKLVAEFRKPRQQAQGITGRLRDIAGRMAERPITPEQPEIEFDLTEISGVRLEPEVERAVVGIVREALQNIRKHADASSVHVEVQRADDMLEVEVRDDGRGIPDALPLIQQDGHFGLEQMRELAEDMGGSLDIQSHQQTGTRIQARIPIIPVGKQD
jgi:signal transduction histidine kinase